MEPCQERCCQGLGRRELLGRVGGGGGVCHGCFDEAPWLSDSKFLFHSSVSPSGMSEGDSIEAEDNNSETA